MFVCIIYKINNHQTNATNELFVVKFYRAKKISSSFHGGKV